MEQKLLIIGYVWPEPNSSAAGTRMMEFIHLFLRQGWEITFSCPAKESEFRYPLEDLGITVKSIVLNDDEFDHFIKEFNPTMVLFDRFMMEEQFGWRVVKSCPDALRMLETVDLHCLRKARHTALKKNRAFEISDLYSDIARREIASIYRCDLSFLISEIEMELLQKYFKVSRKLLHYVPFMQDAMEVKTLAELPTFEDRKNFVTIGGFMHEPNWDSVRFIKEKLWPKLSKLLPQAEMHVYGSYPTQKVLQLNNPKERFFIKGRAEDALEIMRTAKVCLAPLRFGAGIKGKFVDAMLSGTPSVTTTVGAESMYGTLPWNGCITDSEEEMIAAACELYTEKNTWKNAQKNGVALINGRFPKKILEIELLAVIDETQENLEKHRFENFTGSMLLHHTLKSTEYMSRWIQEKNK